MWSGHENLTYTGEAVSVTATVRNLIGEDICTVTVVGGTGTNAGEYTAKATELSNSNYALPEGATQEYSIGKATLTVSISANDRDYDGTTETKGTITLTGAVNGEQPEASGTFAFADKNAGENKTVTAQVALTDAPVNANYKLSTSAPPPPRPSSP